MIGGVCVVPVPLASYVRFDEETDDAIVGRFYNDAFL